MTNTTFESILTKLIAERGIAILDSPAKCNGLLQDYAAGGFKREIRLLMQALDAGYHKDLLNSGEPEITRAILVKKFHDEFGIANEVAEEIIGILALVIKDGGKSEEEKCAEELAALEQSAKNGDILAQCSLGILLRKLSRFEEASEWLEMAAKRELEHWAELNAKPEIKESTPQTIVMQQEQGTSNTMILIKGGTFLMGSPAHEIDRHNDELQHQVTVSSFCMGKYAITQNEYQKVMGINPSFYKGEKLPVEQVSWYDAIEYCNKRSQKEGLIPAYTKNGYKVTWNRNANGYRLPTEAEWEYACRAESMTPFNTGNNITTSQANYDGRYPYHNNAKETRRRNTISVGSFAANPWGLYDMHGNVWEWCWDWYGIYTNAEQTDPAGAVSGNDRVARGGSWTDGGQYLRSACRSYNRPSNWGSSSSFRLTQNVQ